MNKLSNILDKQGKEAVELYRNQLRDNDRVATGKTNASIRYEVKSDSIRSTSLIIYGADHIRDLETGQTAEQIKAKDNPSFFNQIQDWVQARSIGGSNQYTVSARIYRSLLENGWNTTLPNRTGQNGGTKGLITDIDKEVTNNVLNEVKKGSKFLILEQIRTSTNGNFNS